MAISRQRARSWAIAARARAPLADRARAPHDLEVTPASSSGCRAGQGAYNCQQAAEKLIKGLLVLAAAPFRKTHDLDELSEAAAPIYPDLRA
jgi:HEPN domain